MSGFREIRLRLYDEDGERLARLGVSLQQTGYRQGEEYVFAWGAAVCASLKEHQTRLLLHGWCRCGRDQRLRRLDFEG